MTQSIWDRPEMAPGGSFKTFEQPGDTISGTIDAVTVKTWDDGKVSPELILTTDEGEPMTVTAGQIGLKAKLYELRPEAGDWIKITMTHTEKRDKGKTLKHWLVEHKKGNVWDSSPVAQAAPAAPAPAFAPIPQPTPNPVPAQAYPAAQPQQEGVRTGAVDPMAAAAALAALTPEQRAALGL